MQLFIMFDSFKQATVFINCNAGLMQDGNMDKPLIKY